MRIVWILLLSAARLNEMARLQWPEILDQVAVVPGERTTTKLEHAVPAIVDMAPLIGARAEDAGDFAFSTSHGKSAFSGFGKAKKRLDTAIAKLRRGEGLPPMQPLAPA